MIKVRNSITLEHIDHTSLFWGCQLEASEVSYTGGNELADKDDSASIDILGQSLQYI